MSLFISVSVAPSPMPSTSWRSMNMVKWIKARVNVEDGGGARMARSLLPWVMAIVTKSTGSELLGPNAEITTCFLCDLAQVA